MINAQDIIGNIKKPQDLREVALEDFIPYACHLDHNTLLTKNGELMQVIKVTGFHFETVANEAGGITEVRDSIRDAIRNSIDSNQFAFWFHTVRRKRNLSPSGTPPNNFAKDLNEAWVERNDLKNQYSNELYISILIQGEPIKLTNLKTMMRSIIFPLEFRHREKLLDEKLELLNIAAKKVSEKLKDFGAKHLGIYKNKGIYYSEIMKFLGSIVNLQPVARPLAMVDLSDVLPSQNIRFGNNVIEVRSEAGRYFGAMLTIKEYQEMSTEYIDAFLQLPEEFIVTETFDFIRHTEVKEKFEKNKLYHEISGDTLLQENLGINEILDAGQGKVTDYGEHQITIMCLEDSLEGVEDDVVRAVAALNDLGISVIREDVFMEDCYWAQLPGNFEFIKRMSPASSARIAGYCSLYNFPAGKIAKNHWGNAVTTFFTANRTPYFFNFHYGRNGHSLIIGPRGTGKTALVNFLLSECQKFMPKIYYFDSERTSEILVRALSGSYHRIERSEDNHSPRFNPFLLPDSPNHRAFLARWMVTLFADDMHDVEPDDLNRIKHAIEYAYNMDLVQRTLDNIIPRFWPLAEDKRSLSLKKLCQQRGPKKNLEDEKEAPYSTAEKLSVWYGEGEYAHLFSNYKDDLNFDQQFTAFDITHMLQDGYPLLSVAYYMIYRITADLSDERSIIVLDEAWSFLEYPIFASTLSQWLNQLINKDVMVLLTSEDPNKVANSTITRILGNNCSTKIMLPDDQLSDEAAVTLGFTEEEAETIRGLSKEKRQFMLKHNIDSVVAELNLGGMDYFLTTLSARLDDLALMDKLIAMHGKAPEKWLPHLREYIENRGGA